MSSIMQFKKLIARQLYSVCTLQEKHPWDVMRHIRLLRQYMSVGAVNEAYTRITTLSPAVQCSFAASLDWNRCVCDAFKVSRECVNVKFHL